MLHGIYIIIRVSGIQGKRERKRERKRTCDVRAHACCHQNIRLHRMSEAWELARKNVSRAQKRIVIMTRDAGYHISKKENVFSSLSRQRSLVLQESLLGRSLGPTALWTWRVMAITGREEAIMILSSSDDEGTSVLSWRG